MTKTQLNRILKAMIGSDELVDQWWTSKNRAFLGQTPNEVFDTDPEQVINYILSYYQR